MKPLIATVALIASLNVAHACTDWKAVAAFDAIVVEHARMAVVEEKDPEIAAIVKHNCDFVTSLVNAAAERSKQSGDPKDAKLFDQRLTQLNNCDTAAARYQKVLMDLDMDRDHALTDNCR